MSKSMRKVL
jgi:hypothetical protein